MRLIENDRALITAACQSAIAAACRSALVLWSSLVQHGVAWDGIEPNFGLLDAVEGLSLEKHRQDLVRKRGAERMLQEAIDVAVDTNSTSCEPLQASA